MCNVSDHVVGVRLEPAGPVIFCHTVMEFLERGQRVTVAWVAGGDGAREGVVAIAPERIIAAPPLDDAPRVVGIAPTAEDVREAPLPAGVIFLPATEGAIGPADLRHALRLAASPLPEAPPERR